MQNDWHFIDLESDFEAIDIVIGVQFYLDRSAGDPLNRAYHSDSDISDRRVLESPCVKENCI